MDVDAVIVFFFSLSRTRRVGIDSASRRLMLSSRFCISAVIWSSLILVDSLSSLRRVGPSPPPWTTSVMNFSLLLPHREDPCLELLPPSPDLVELEQHLLLLPLGRAEPLAKLRLSFREVCTAVSQATCPSSWEYLTRSFRCSSSLSSCVFISPGPRELDLELGVGLRELLLRLGLLLVEPGDADDLLYHLPLLVRGLVCHPGRRALGDYVEAAGRESRDLEQVGDLALGRLLAVEKVNVLAVVPELPGDRDDVGVDRDLPVDVVELDGGTAARRAAPRSRPRLPSPSSGRR